MKILVTGANGFVGKNLVENLKAIRDGKNKTRPNIQITDIYEYDIENTEDELRAYCKDCDFVFNLAGVNRPENNDEFREGNFGFASKLLDMLKESNNKCPVMLSSSTQATLIGRYNNDYGKSKKAGEDLFFAYGEETGAKVLVYRFPNLAGKWVRPNYNSAVGTFCYNIANDLPVTVSDPNIELELLFIDDLVIEMFDALEQKEHRCDYNGLDVIRNNEGRFCFAPITHRAKLGYIVECLNKFHQQPQTLVMPSIPKGSFESRLYSMYLTYLPKNKISFPLKMNVDARGSFTELMRTENCGQFSVNVSNPGIMKGQHWHNSKWEFFIVVSGHALIEERKIGSDEVISFEVSGDKLEAVHMIPGYTHNIYNLSDTEKLVTVMWINEQFNPDEPDTIAENV